MNNTLILNIQIAERYLFFPQNESFISSNNEFHICVTHTTNMIFCLFQRLIFFFWGGKGWIQRFIQELLIFTSLIQFNRRTELLVKIKFDTNT